MLFPTFTFASPSFAFSASNHLHHLCFYSLITTMKYTLPFYNLEGIFRYLRGAEALDSTLKATSSSLHSLLTTLTQNRKKNSKWRKLGNLDFLNYMTAPLVSMFTIPFPFQVFLSLMQITHSKPHLALNST